MIVEWIGRCGPVEMFVARVRDYLLAIYSEHSAWWCRTFASLCHLHGSALEIHTVMNPHILNLLMEAQALQLVQI